MEKTLDTKLEKIRRGQYKPDDFIIADAKDADMGGGIFFLQELSLKMLPVLGLIQNTCRRCVKWS